MLLPSSAESIARSVGLRRTPTDIVRAAVEVSRRILGADSTFAAVSNGRGSFPMTEMSGIRDPRFGDIEVRPGAGLGGQVLLRKTPLGVADYAHDPTISGDFVHVVCEIEGLGGMGCVPIVGPEGIEALLYVGRRIAESPGDTALDVLQHVATYAELALHHLGARQRAVELELLRERQRLAFELHDSVAQMLFAIGVAAQHSRRQQDPAALVAAMEEIEVTAAQARRELRETLERIGRYGDGVAFEARLEGEVRLFERSCDCRVRITRSGESRELPEPVESLVLDALLEGLRNAAKHAAAGVAVAHLRYAPDSVALVLQTELHDAPVEPDAPGTGVGLALLARRAEQLRGALELSAEPNGLKVLRLELPTRIAALP